MNSKSQICDILSSPRQKVYKEEEESVQLWEKTTYREQDKSQESRRKAEKTSQKSHEERKELTLSECLTGQGLCSLHHDSLHPVTGSLGAALCYRPGGEAVRELGGGPGEESPLLRG